MAKLLTFIVAAVLVYALQLLVEQSGAGAEAGGVAEEEEGTEQQVAADVSWGSSYHGGLLQLAAGYAATATAVAVRSTSNRGKGPVLLAAWQPVFLWFGRTRMPDRIHDGHGVERRSML